MAISAKDVMELRKQTDCGMMECKKALTEADGNFEKAIEILRERGLATAAKKASRTAAEGMVYADYCPQCKVGVVIEVNAETDFVAKNDKFVAFVKEATQVIMKQNPADVEALMACKTENGETVDEALKNLILVIKENIKVRRFVRYEGVCSAYVHGGGTHGILVNFETTNGIEAKDEFVTYGKDIAMQVAAANPGYVDEASVPAEVVAKEKEIMLAQMAGDPKAANIPRPISLCEVNQKDGLLRIVFRIVGAGTKEFAAKEKDDEIRILGPLGNGFPLDACEKDKTAVLIGGGIGIPPLLELAKQLPCKTTVVVGYRNADAFLREELEEAADRVVIASDDGSIGIKGTVLDAMEAEGVTGDCIFSCGPTPMLRGVKQWAFEKQIPAWISMEEKMACGIGACLACVCESKEIDSHSKVKNKRICKDGPVFLSTDIEL